MLFHLTTDDYIRAINEQRPAETDAGGSTFTSEQELHALAKEWPMKRLVAIWNRLPGVPAVARFTDRKTAIATHLASHSAANRSRSSERAAAPFQSAAEAYVSGGLEGGPGLDFVVPAGRRHATRDPKPNRVAGPYRAGLYLAQPVQAKLQSALV